MERGLELLEPLTEDVNVFAHLVALLQSQSNHYWAGAFPRWIPHCCNWRWRKENKKRFLYLHSRWSTLLYSYSFLFFHLSAQFKLIRITFHLLLHSACFYGLMTIKYSPICLCELYRWTYITKTRRQIKKEFDFVFARFHFGTFVCNIFIFLITK